MKSKRYPTNSLNQIETLSEFLTLNSDEVKLQKELETLINNNNIELETILTKTSNMIIFIKIAAISPTFFKFIKQKKFEAFWKEAWRLMGANPNGSHEMLPQPNIDCCTLYFGNFFFREADRIRKTIGRKYSSIELAFLEKAESYYSFHAINSLNKYDLSQLQMCITLNQPCSSLNSIINRAVLAAQYHETPGYLILAETCYKIANYNQHILKCDTAVASSVKLSLKYYIIAEKKYEHSQSAINNAYYGQGLSASNYYKIDNVAEMKQLMITNAKGYLDDGAIAWAEYSAKSELDPPEFYPQPSRLLI